MPLDHRFFAAVAPLFDAGMGTESAGPLLYGLVRMQRPRSVLAVGLGYSTMFILQALADNAEEAQHDSAVMNRLVHDPGRAGVLHPGHEHRGYAPHCTGIDDFTAGADRRAALEQAVDTLSLGRFFTLSATRFENTALPPQRLPLQFAWIDCGHQLDYAALVNRCWPLLERDGGLLALHYSHVDIDLPAEHGGGKAMVSGPVANAMRRQQLAAGLGAGFELLSLVEPHKCRQGSVLLARRLDPGDAVRDVDLGAEQRVWYGAEGEALHDLNGDARPVPSPGGN